MCRVESAINPSRNIGVEIECVVPIIGRGGSNHDIQELLSSVLTANGIPSVARSYSHSPVPAGCKLAIEHDSSLRDECRYEGLRWSQIEIKTCPSTWAELESILPKALDIIKYVGARTNASCGFHVHHALPEVVERPVVVRNLQHLYWRFSQVVFGLVSTSRRANYYCQTPQRHQAVLFDRVRTYADLCEKLNTCDRHWGLNLTNLSAQGRQTVEWRMHQSTTEWAKISAWVLATQRWIEHSIARSCHYREESLPNSQASLNALLVTTGLKSNSRIYRKVDKPLREVGRYLLRRWKHFKAEAVAA